MTVEKGRAVLDFEGIVCSELIQCWKGIVQHGRLTRFEARLIPEPVLSLTEETSFLGRWTPVGNVIAISRSLIYNHPWYAVLDVFYHEVAHQITHYLYPNANEPSHGRLFRHICERIGASPAASTSVKELDERLFASNSDGSLDPMTDRIRKLLTLAEKGDEHEAEVALAKAVEIMEKYGIDENSIHDDGFVTISVGQPAKQITAEDSYMLAILSNFLFVKTICTYRTNPENGEQERLRMVCGTPVHTRIASYVYDSIQSHIDIAWRRYCAENDINPNLVRRRRDYAIGALQSLHDRLGSNAQLSDSKALVHVSDAGLNDYFHSRFPNIRTTHHNASHDKDALNAGRAAGRDINIHDGVTDGNPNSRLLKP